MADYGTTSSDRQSSSPSWQVCIDTGGTFNDCIAAAPDGTTRRAKVLSTGALRGRVLEVISPRSIRIAESWNAPNNFVQGWTFTMLADAASPAQVLNYTRSTESAILELDTMPQPLTPNSPFEVRGSQESPIVAARLVTQTPAGQPLPPLALRLATTRGTTALLERRAGPVVFFVTQGFADLLTIGTQQRPDLFALNIIKPRPLYDQVVEVPGRLTVDGSVLRELDLAALDPHLADLKSRGIRVAAIALLHSWKNSAHERALVTLLRAHGFTHVSCSSDMGAAIKLLPRAQTAVVDAYLAPVIESYLANVSAGLAPGSTLHAMTSAGGLVGAAAFRPKDSLLSGPSRWRRWRSRRREPFWLHPPHLLRHGRHQHRRSPLRRRSPVRLRAPGRRRPDRRPRRRRRERRRGRGLDLLAR